MICIYIVRELAGREGCAVGRGNSTCKNPEAAKYKSHTENLEEIQSGGAIGRGRRKSRWERMTEPVATRLKTHSLQHHFYRCRVA